MAAKLRPKVYGEKLDISGGMEVRHGIAGGISAMTDDELRAAIAKQMLALGLTKPVIDVEATDVQPEDVIDLVELNKSLGDIDQKPRFIRPRAKEVR
jgi:hypothetical protein